MSRGWGFQIDYAKAIADDEARIAWAELSIRHGWYSRAVGNHGYVADQLWELILYFPDVAHAAGFSLQDAADYARFADADLAWTHNPALPEARQDAAGWQRGKEINAEIERIGGRLFENETAARTDLRKAKASRARHIRNREQYGRQTVSKPLVCVSDLPTSQPGITLFSMTLLAHSTVVILPAEFTSHRLQRMFLTRRHATRMVLPELLEMRRERTAQQPTVYAPDGTSPTPRFNWSALASVALMILIVVITTACATIRH